MPVPDSLQDLIDRLTLELNETESLVNRELELLQPLLNLFVTNNAVIRYVAYFNNVRFFIEITRRKLQASIDALSFDRVASTEIQETGEELSELFGRVLETKIETQQIIENREF